MLAGVVPYENAPEPTETPTPTVTPTPTATPTQKSGGGGGAAPQCNDGVDNDGDGAIDLRDKECADANDNDEAR